MGLFVTIRFDYTLVSEYNGWIGELIKNDRGAEGFAGYRNYALLEGALERIEPRHNGISLEKHFPILSPPVRLHRNNTFF